MHETLDGHFAPNAPATQLIKQRDDRTQSKNGAYRQGGFLPRKPLQMSNDLRKFRRYYRDWECTQSAWIRRYMFRLTARKCSRGLHTKGSDALAGKQRWKEKARVTHESFAMCRRVTPGCTPIGPTKYIPAIGRGRRSSRLPLARYRVLYTHSSVTQ